VEQLILIAWIVF